MQKLKNQKIQEILDQQNAAIDADMNNKRKGRLKYLLQQTEIFTHFAGGNQSASQKIKGRGRHESKITEEEEDEECLKEEEDGLSGTGNTRLLSQPSCGNLLHWGHPLLYCRLAPERFCFALIYAIILPTGCLQQI
ncbi:probable chromatin-remodeling complex ATPase chain isoform X1 [Eucalyptus grandis]|uniref:probable chromatin-remodeling complex ATPase chain isoform X1 n=1 Tax=Eucalyptus grandis TaxID=71139 RepID=UPI00192EB3C0|nr:probable chromatin-remodeling complex ATPase chain isoform X1 [Eucalyptus grandis]XP_039154711.1 probable chromatin-remodeling complex ATPase chain isoform X1 [Eucalyptus grandis]